MNKIKVLLVDDEIEMLNSIEKILSKRGDLKVQAENDPEKAIKLIERQKFNLIITDLKMGNISGIDVLKKAMNHLPESKVIIISGYGTIEAGVEATKLGAFDFIEKPFTSKKLYDKIDLAIKEFVTSPRETNFENSIDEQTGIVSKSKQMQEIISLVNKVSQGNMTVLITGESGTGKELIARAIHKLSNRSVNPFVPVNCGALPESLFESELFGHEKGAFTGAVRTKPGLLEFANEGTFFFDEIGDMSPALQVKLLRMLEERKIRRVGGEREINIDIRIIAATNQDIENMVKEKKFREDLYFRLNMMKIEIPPLRERPEDIIPLAKYFLKEVCAQHDGKKKIFTERAEELLENYSWPGNARELQNLVARASYLCTSTTIDSSDIPIPGAKDLSTLDNSILELPFKDAKNKIIENFEIAYLTHYLKKNAGNVSKTAEECGIDRRHLHRLINNYNIVYED